MTTYQWLSLMALVLIHVAGSFLWAGKIGTVVNALGIEVAKLRTAKHETANKLTTFAMEIDMLKEDVGEIKKDLKRE